MPNKVDHLKNIYLLWYQWFIQDAILKFHMYLIFAQMKVIINHLTNLRQIGFPHQYYSRPWQLAFQILCSLPSSVHLTCRCSMSRSTLLYSLCSRITAHKAPVNWCQGWIWLASKDTTQYCYAIIRSWACFIALSFPYIGLVWVWDMWGSFKYFMSFVAVLLKRPLCFLCIAMRNINE